MICGVLMLNQVIGMKTVANLLWEKSPRVLTICKYIACEFDLLFVFLPETWSGASSVGYSLQASWFDWAWLFWFAVDWRFHR